ncbi:MAG: site-specific integrase [Lachnospiraceae bacterium]|nr:site-specific integrase [Lachnospiraceae bacterium]
MIREKTNNLNTVSEQWLQYVLFTRKYSTYVKYQNIYSKYIQPQVGEKDMEQITVSDCTNLLETAYGQYRENAISHSTFSSIKIVLFQILTYGKSPVSVPEIKASLPAARKNYQQISVLTNEEQAKLKSFLLCGMDSYKLGVLVCLYTGLRLGEICALKTESIDLSRKCIYVIQTVQRIKSEDKGGKTQLMISEPKTASSRREIPLCDLLLKLLMENKPKTEYLLGDKPTEPRTYQYRLNQYFSALSIKGKHFHSLRHTFATNCIESGMDPKCLSEILGHADVNTTLNRYVHPSFNSKIRQINIFADSYGQMDSF